MDIDIFRRSEKNMIDSLRCRNGNLNITLSITSGIEIKAL